MFSKVIKENAPHTKSSLSGQLERRKYQFFPAGKGTITISETFPSSTLLRQHFEKIISAEASQ